MIRVGLLGCGFIGTVHSLALKGLVRAGFVDAEVSSVLDRDPGKASATASAHGARVATDLDDLVEAVDVVWVCLPTAGHLEAVERCARSGTAVFCEKPLGRDVAEAEAVAAALSRVPHRVGLVLRSAPVFARLRDEVASGRHGRVMAAIFRDDQAFPLGGIYGSTWRADADEAGSGTLLEHSIHDVDLLRWLLGDPSSVSGRTSNFAGHAGVEDVATVQLTFPGEAQATLTSVWHRIETRPSTRRLEVFCEDALLSLVDDNLGPLRVESGDGGSELAGEPPAWTSAFDLPAEYAKPVALYATTAKEFLDDLSAGVTPRGPDGADAVAAHRIVDAAYRSAAAGGDPLVP